MFAFPPSVCVIRFVVAAVSFYHLGYFVSMLCLLDPSEACYFAYLMTSWGILKHTSIYCFKSLILHLRETQHCMCSEPFCRTLLCFSMPFPWPHPVPKSHPSMANCPVVYSTVLLFPRSNLGVTDIFLTPRRLLPALSPLSTHTLTCNVTEHVSSQFPSL